MMKYKGYYGSVYYSDDDRVFHGKLEFIKALVSYEGTDVQSLKHAFEEAVDDYIALCAEQGKKPEKPFKGSFNVRIPPELHQRIASSAQTQGMTINKYIVNVLAEAAGKNS